MGRRSTYNVESSAINAYSEKFLPPHSKLTRRGVRTHIQNIAQDADPSNRGKRLYPFKIDHLRGYMVSDPDNPFLLVNAVTVEEAKAKGYI